MTAAAVLTPRGLRVGNRILPCAIGSGGLRRDKREGDMATPRGLHRVEATLYRADRLARPAPWALPIGPRDLWSDDPDDPAYNGPARAPHPFGHERLRRPDPLYDVVIVLDWNRSDAIPGKGSAIFIHQWRKPRHPSAGCIALGRGDLLWFARRAAPGTPVAVP